MKTLLFLLLFAPAICNAQKCLSKVDDFTGKSLKMGSTYLLGSFSPLGPAIHLINNADTLSIGFSFSASLQKSDFTPEKMFFMVKFKNGVIKKFNSSKDTKIASYNRDVIISFVSTITSDDLKYLAENAMQKVRLSYNGEDFGFDNDISEKRAAQIMKSVGCLK